MCCTRWYMQFVGWMNALQSPFLLILRGYWGWQFLQTGTGKLQHIEKIVEFFQELGIPYPLLNAYVVGSLEAIGGALLILGLASRLISIPLTGILTVAYLTADLDAVKGFFSDPASFAQAAPFPFLMVTLTLLCFGPGKWSLDALICRWGAKQCLAKSLPRNASSR